MLLHGAQPLGRQLEEIFVGDAQGFRCQRFEGFRQPFAVLIEHRALLLEPALHFRDPRLRRRARALSASRSASSNAPACMPERRELRAQLLRSGLGGGGPPFKLPDNRPEAAARARAAAINPSEQAAQGQP